LYFYTKFSLLFSPFYFFGSLFVLSLCDIQWGVAAVVGLLLPQEMFLRWWAKEKAGLLIMYFHNLLSFDIKLIVSIFVV
jgi:hypothetical protein